MQIVNPNNRDFVNMRDKITIQDSVQVKSDYIIILKSMRKRNYGKKEMYISVLKGHSEEHETMLTDLEGIKRPKTT